MIRVTPTDGEPIELPEDTECVPTSPPFGKFIGFEFGIVQLECYDGTAYAREPSTLAVILDNGWRDAYVRIGDAWPLREIETWRERAERLERELAKLLGAP